MDYVIINMEELSCQMRDFTSCKYIQRIKNKQIECIKLEHKKSTDSVIHSSFIHMDQYSLDHFNSCSKK